MGFRSVSIYGETKEEIAIKFDRLPMWVYPSLIHGKKDIDIIDTISYIDKYEDEGKIRYNLILPTYLNIYAKGMYEPEDYNIIRMEIANEEVFKEIFNVIQYVSNDISNLILDKNYRYGKSKPYIYYEYPSDAFIFEIDNLYSTTNIICATFFKTGFDYGNNFIDFIIKGSYDYYNCRKRVDLKNVLK